MEVGDQGEMKLVCFRVGLMTPGSVDRNADQFGAMLPELRQYHIVEGHLIATNGTPVGWIESEDHAAALEVAER